MLFWSFELKDNYHHRDYSDSFGHVYIEMASFYSPTEFLILKIKSTHSYGSTANFLAQKYNK